MHCGTARRHCLPAGSSVTGCHEGLVVNGLGATLQQLQRWDEARTVLFDSLC